MLINNISNETFNGRLILQGNHWTPLLDHAIKSNTVITKLLKNTDKDLYVTLKHRLATPDEIYQMGKDEDLYRIIFKLKKEVKGFFQKTLNIFNSKNINLTKHYHSEDTTVSLLASCDNLSGIFTKQNVNLKNRIVNFC